MPARTRPAAARGGVAPPRADLTASDVKGVRETMSAADLAADTIQHRATLAVECRGLAFTPELSVSHVAASASGPVFRESFTCTANTASATPAASGAGPTGSGAAVGRKKKLPAAAKDAADDNSPSYVSTYLARSLWDLDACGPTVFAGVGEAIADDDDDEGVTAKLHLMGGSVAVDTAAARLAVWAAAGPAATRLDPRRARPMRAGRGNDQPGAGKKTCARRAANNSGTGGGDNQGGISGRAGSIAAWWNGRDGAAMRQAASGHCRLVRRAASTTAAGPAATTPTPTTSAVEGQRRRFVDPTDAEAVMAFLALA